MPSGPNDMEENGSVLDEDEYFLLRTWVQKGLCYSVIPNIESQLQKLRLFQKTNLHTLFYEKKTLFSTFSTGTQKEFYVNPVSH